MCLRSIYAENKAKNGHKKKWISVAFLHSAKRKSAEEKYHQKSSIKNEIAFSLFKYCDFPFHALYQVQERKKKFALRNFPKYTSMY